MQVLAVKWKIKANSLGRVVDEFKAAKHNPSMTLNQKYTYAEVFLYELNARTNDLHYWFKTPMDGSIYTQW